MKLKELNDFWKEQAEQPERIQFVNFVDGESQTIEIKNWKVFEWEYQGKNWDNAQLLKTIDGQYLKINNQSLKTALFEHLGKHICVVITRYDSKPNPLDTWFTIKLKKLTQKQTVKDSN
jgi:hypothetical protein